MGNSVAVKGDFKQEIFNEVNENVRALERLFPSVVKDGQVDFQALKEELGNFEEVGPEKYGLTWSGKQNAKKIAQEDIVGKTLKFIPEDSKNPDRSENLYIEGDNLEVLKLLRQNYYGAIKMIYIDPPYNTGNDFVYNDNFSMDKIESDMAEGNISELGESYVVNSKSTNKYHANWLNMIYTRLIVARDLLRDDGIIFISIDDNEIGNLRIICDKIFHIDNFITAFVWKKRTGSNDSQNGVSVDHEYILAYFKGSTGVFNGIKKGFENYKNPDNDPRGEWMADNLTCNKTASERPNLYYPITDPKTQITYQCNPNRVWAYERERMNRNINENKIIFPKDGKGTPMYKRHKEEVRSDTKPYSSIIDTHINSVATKEVREVLSSQVFNYPKSINLIKQILLQATDTNSIILDFFSGSSTTAHSVMQLNAEDGGNRKFIMVQLPEVCDEKSEAYKAGYKNICEIGKKRIHLAGEKIKEENKDKEGIDDLDIGFKVFRVGDTNIRWNYECANLKTLSSEITVNDTGEQTSFDFIAATKQVTIDDVVSPKDRLDFMPYVKDIDVVYEILLRQRDIPLSAKIELLKDIGKRTYLFADSYLICLEEDITNELIEKLAAINPLPIKFVLRDSAFGDDIALKDEAYRRLKALIERNTGETKKTYTVEFI